MKSIPKSLSILFALGMVLMLMLSGCSQPAAPAPAGEAPAPAGQEQPEPTEAVPAQETKQLVIARDFDLNTVDPHRAFEDTALIVLKAMYDQLTAVDPKNPSEVIPHLAQDWSVSDDGLVYTFNLRPGVKFTSGNELTAEDVKFSLDRLKNLNGNPAFLMTGVASVEAVDPLTVHITLEAPSADFLARTSAIYMAIVDSQLAMENGATSGPDAADTDQAEEWFNSASAGSGPFILESWTRNQDIRFTANTDYWAGPPNVDSVIMRDLKDITTQKQLLQQGDIDIAMNIDPDAAGELEGAPGVVIQQERGYNQVYLGITQVEDISSDLATSQGLRQAIGYAIDYDGLTQGVLAGNAEQPPSIVPLGFLSADRVEPLHRDLDMATQLLSDAGYPDGVDLQLYYPNATYYGVDFNIVVQKLQADLAEAGINIEPVPQAPSVFLPAYRATELPMVVSYWAPDWIDPSSLIDSFATPTSGVAKRLGYVNEENAELSAAALATTDQEQRAEIYADIQRNLQTDAHLLGLVQPKVVLAYRDNIENYVYHPVATLDIYAVDKQ